VKISSTGRNSLRATARRFARTADDPDVPTGPHHCRSQFDHDAAAKHRGDHAASIAEISAPRVSCTVGPPRCGCRSSARTAPAPPARDQGLSEKDGCRKAPEAGSGAGAAPARQTFSTSGRPKQGRRKEDQHDDQTSRTPRRLVFHRESTPDHTYRSARQQSARIGAGRDPMRQAPRR